MDPLDPPNSWRGILYLARPCQFTFHCSLGHDALLRWSSGRMWSNFWHRSFHFSTIFGHNIWPNRCRWELWLRTDPVGVLQLLKILHSNRPLLNGGHDCRLHSSRDIGALPTVGKHVPPTFKGRDKRYWRTLLRVRVEWGGEAEGYAPGKSQVRGEQPVRAWQTRCLSTNPSQFYTISCLVNKARSTCLHKMSTKLLNDEE